MKTLLNSIELAFLAAAISLCACTSDEPFESTPVTPVEKPSTVDKEKEEAMNRFQTATINVADTLVLRSFDDKIEINAEFISASCQDMTSDYSVSYTGGKELMIEGNILGIGSYNYTTIDAELPALTVKFEDKKYGLSMEKAVSVMVRPDEIDTPTEKVLYITEPGTLTNRIAEKDYTKIRKLTVYGFMNTADLKLIRKLSGAEMAMKSGNKGDWGMILEPYEGFFEDVAKESPYQLEYLDLAHAVFVEDDTEYFYMNYSGYHYSNMFICCPTLKEVYLPENMDNAHPNFVGNVRMEVLHIPSYTFAKGGGEIRPDVLWYLAYETISANMKRFEVGGHLKNGFEFGYTSIDGVLYTQNKQILVKYPCAKDGKEYRIAAGVGVSNEAFASCKYLTDVWFEGSSLPGDELVGKDNDGFGYEPQTIFDDCRDDLKLHVPSGSLKYYQNLFPGMKIVEF